MLGILSDAHGNGAAFDLVVEQLAKLGATRFMFLGDAVGYIPSAAVVRSLIHLGPRVECLRGNHEDMLLRGRMEPKQDLVYQLVATHELLSEEELSFLASWPDHRVVAFPSGDALFVHGSPADALNGYVYPDTDLASFETSQAFVFMGHSHHPFVRHQGETTFVNVGSCGLPRDDGRFAAAAMFDEQTGAVRLLRFDIVRATSLALAQAGPVHSSVTSVFARRKEKVLGEFDAE
jgi:predicted phosphodiesterase